MDKIALTFAKISNRSQQHKEMCFVAAMKMCMDTVVSRQLQLFRILVTGQRIHPRERSSWVVSSASRCKIGVAADP